MFEMIKQLYGVEELQGYAEQDITFVRECFGSIPLTLEEFWRKAGRTGAIHQGDDQWISPEDFRKWDWLKNSSYLVLLNENQSCCRAGIRRSDLAETDPPVYVTMDVQEWTLSAETVSEFLQGMLAYESIFTLPFHVDEYILWLTEEEMEIVRYGLKKQPFEVHGWMNIDLMSFYSNAPDNMAVVMDCGDLEIIYGAASEAGYEKMMEVMEGLGEA